MRILVVEDEPDLADAVASGLRRDGYAVDVADDGATAYDRLDCNEYDLVCLDLGLPDLDGMTLCKALAEGDVGDRSTRVIVLTARGSLGDRVAGLDAGADDYLVKPFALKELKARLRALLRRSGPAGASPLRFGDLVLDPVAYEVERGGRRIELSRTEFHLLALVLEHPRQVLTRSQIFERVWGYDFGASSNALGVYVGYLRRKTEAGGESRVLHTVRGVGYVLRDG